MAGRAPAVAIAFLVLVVMPGMASAGKIPRFLVSPKTGKALRDFFKNHAKDVVGLLPTGSPSSSQGGDGADHGSSNAPSPPTPRRARHAPATTAVTYSVAFAVGSQQDFSGALDVTSEFVWVPCCATGNSSCGTNNNMPGVTVYDARPEELYKCESDTCQRIVKPTCNTTGDLCEYTYTYGYGGDDGRETTGNLAVQNFTFGDDSEDTAVKGVVTFGCSSSTEGDFGASGVLGLNKGSLSLVSQLNLGRFSYYFAPEVNTTDNNAADDFIVFGDDDGITVPGTSGGSRPRYTPFFTTGAVSSANLDLYFVELTGIRVGGKDLQLGGGGGGSAGGSLEAVLSTSVPVTYLEKNAYGLLKKELVSALGSNNTEDGSALGLDLCYRSQHMDRAKIPDMAFVFGGNAVMKLQQWNYLYQDEDTGLECLTILPSPDDSDGLSLIGSMIQTGTYMIYDLHKSRLGFQTSDPPPSQSSDLPSNPTSSATAQPKPRGVAVAVVTMACFVWCLVVLNA